MAQKPWTDPRTTKRRCWIKGCPEFGKWVVEPAGYRDGGHFDRAHTNAKPDQFVTQREIEARTRALGEDRRVSA